MPPLSYREIVLNIYIWINKYKYASKQKHATCVQDAKTGAVHLSSLGAESANGDFVMGVVHAMVSGACLAMVAILTCWSRWSIISLGDSVVFLLVLRIGWSISIILSVSLDTGFVSSSSLEFIALIEPNPKCHNDSVEMLCMCNPWRRLIVHFDHHLFINQRPRLSKYKSISQIDQTMTCTLDKVQQPHGSGITPYQVISDTSMHCSASTSKWLIWV